MRSPPGAPRTCKIGVLTYNRYQIRKALAALTIKVRASWGDELHALKRINLTQGVVRAELQFLAPDEPGEYVYTVYLVSDSYIGLDQQLEVRVRVHE